MAVTIYHNPRCSKSRETLELLRKKKIEPEIIEYLKTPPSAAELKTILGQLKLNPRDLMRKKEEPYTKLGLDNESLSETKLIQAMVDNPVLIERPIVLNGKKAALGRPPEKVLEIL
jgi:arsenate reductase (glutaredoxin)